MHPPPDSTRPDTNSRRRPRATPPSRANVSETIGVLSGPRRAEPYENIYPPGGANSQGSYFAHHLHVTYGPSFIKDLFNSIGVFSAPRIDHQADPEYAYEPFVSERPRVRPRDPRGRSRFGGPALVPAAYHSARSGVSRQSLWRIKCSG